ncbi:hypothetical protein BT63DRAFT_452761 [Microthyrium microscopicum]|uniref:Flavodoxin domain-containing protein n=1 Tax=Microthyrium microscopicum TaxID=703497 RepID=A0A6A6UKN5_9PEZI|nr:hypothetical protein BT63DRAFT_452761 [Microthyrium microscopicum]
MDASGSQSNQVYPPPSSNNAVGSSNTKILITYASVNGSTKEIATQIGSIISSKIQSPTTVSILPMDQVTELPQYQFIIIGSAVHNFEWVSPAKSWLSSNHTILSAKRVWAFSVGTPFAVGKFAQRMMESEEEESKLEKAITDEIGKVEDHVLFNGRFLKSHASTRFNVWWRVMGGKFGDFRDTEKIDSWAEEVGNKIIESLGELEMA